MEGFSSPPGLKISFCLFSCDFKVKASPTSKVVKVKPGKGVRENRGARVLSYILSPMRLLNSLSHSLVLFEFH